ncbi:MAG: NADH-quinone oxidoreductase subunit C [Proteobacteria bacterium]|nr:NADH-quinone oxidoreductase subunit C [Pseudomonadota bacterium]MBU1595556.1 NADH-quinone oxidoreductase subunit C [Pseudomonadota bacterium]
MSIEALPVAPADLLAAATRLKNDGYRFVTMTSVELDQTNMEILYHFDKSLALKNLRVPVEKGGELPSISGVVFAAFLVENEIRDQYAVRFEGLVLDYQGKLYAETAQTAASSPFCRYHVKAEPDPGPGSAPGGQPGSLEGK